MRPAVTQAAALSQKPVQWLDWLSERLGTRKWVIEPRLTARLKEKGYEVALSGKRYSELEVDYEREVYGAPLKSLHAAAPDLLKIARDHQKTIEFYIRQDESRGDDEGARLKSISLALVNAAIAKAEGAR